MRNLRRPWPCRGTPRGAAGLLACLLAATVAAADEPIRVKRHAHPGQEVLIRGFAEFDGHCRLVKVQTITVVEAPAHGTVTTRPGTVTIEPNWVGATDCTGTKLPGVHFYYRPAPDFTGTDRVVFDVGYTRRTVRAEAEITVE